MKASWPALILLSITLDMEELSSRETSSRRTHRLDLQYTGTLGVPAYGFGQIGVNLRRWEAAHARLIEGDQFLVGLATTPWSCRRAFSSSCMIADAEYAKIVSLKSRLPVSVGCLPFDCRLPLSS